MPDSSLQPDDVKFPGWYQDADDVTAERFWNGNAWTDMTRSLMPPESLLGPIDPGLQAMMDSYDGKHPPLAERVGHPGITAQ